MTDYEKQMLAKMDALLAEIREIKEMVKRPMFKVVQGGRVRSDDYSAAPGRRNGPKFW